MKRQTRRWLRGMLEAAIPAASTSIAALIVEPEFMTAEKWWKVPAIAAASFALAVVNYLKANPLPEEAPRPPRTRHTPPPAATIGAVLLIASLGVAGCAGKHLELAVQAQTRVHAELAKAHDTIERVCTPDTPLVAVCQEVNGVVVHALRAGRAFSQAVLEERLEGLGRVVEEVGRLVGAVRKLPPSALRDDILAALQRAVDSAFKGAQ